MLEKLQLKVNFEKYCWKQCSKNNVKILWLLCLNYVKNVQTFFFTNFESQENVHMNILHHIYFGSWRNRYIGCEIYMWIFSTILISNCEKYTWLFFTTLILNHDKNIHMNIHPINLVSNHNRYNGYEMLMEIFIILIYLA